MRTPALHAQQDLRTVLEIAYRFYPRYMSLIVRGATITREYQAHRLPAAEPQFEHALPALMWTHIEYDDAAFIKAILAHLGRFLDVSSPVERSISGPSPVAGSLTRRQVPKDGLIAGILEWSSESGVEPELFIASTAHDVRRAVAQRLFRSLPSDQHPAGEIDDIDLAWVADHPKPDLDKPDAVAAWLQELKDASTDAWLTLYSPDTDRYIENSYTDLRKPS